MPGKIGSFGKVITFAVSEDKVLTFRNMTATQAATWGEVPQVGKPPKAQFLGVEAMEVTMEIILDATLGVSPSSVRDALYKAMREGQVEYLVVGKQKIGDSKMYISAISDAYGIVMSGGEVVRMVTTVTLRQYT